MCHCQLCGHLRMSTFSESGEFCPSSTVESVSLVTPVRGTLRRISFHFQLWLLHCSFICPSVHLSVHPPTHPFIHESIHPCTHPSSIPPFILLPSTSYPPIHPSYFLRSDLGVKPSTPWERGGTSPDTQLQMQTHHGAGMTGRCCPCGDLPES